MTFRQSATLIQAQLDTLESTIGTSPVLRIYSGQPPASVAAAVTGTLLGSATLPSDWLANAAASAKAQLGTWSGTGGASGYVGYGRVFESTGTTAFMQFCIGQAWAATTPYVVGQQVNNGGNCYKCSAAGTSASSGGPTGTGASITDGGVTWAYVEPADLVMDNTNIANSQVFSLSGVSINGTANL